MHCQARSENKLYFHFNMATTSIGVAKAAHYLTADIEEGHPRPAFSISDIKTSYFNELMLQLILSNFEIDLELDKNKKAIRKFMEFGKIAA